ncbi:DsrE family protein [Haladaptatus sp. CMAA 1911]|uniref:DsrE family protein n=2 Tax=unclassified Haladaptatus TaxID=2622732 RepID=UPI003754BFAE
MQRRKFVSVTGTLGALLLGSESTSAKNTEHPAQHDSCARPAPKTQTVLHLSSGDSMAHKGALMNGKNLLDDESVPVKDLVVLANSKGVQLYTPPTDDNEFADQIASLQDRGVTFRACGNAMEMLGLTKDDLLSGVERVPSGVGELARFQALDFGYIKVP